MPPGGTDRRSPAGTRTGREPGTDGPAEAGPTATASPREWNETWALAVVFGAASVPWTYGFVAGLHLPLWPAFVASASFFAAGGGIDGLLRGYLGNVTGIAYAVATLALVNAAGGGPVALSAAVGGFMFLASLQAFVPRLSFTPGAFFGYATLFGVHASGARVPGLSGLTAEAAAAVVAMLIGACIGLAAERASRAIA